MYAGPGPPASANDASSVAATAGSASRAASGPPPPGALSSSPTCMCEAVPFIEPAKHTVYAAKQRRIGHVELKRLEMQGGVLGSGGYLSLYLLHHSIPFHTTIHPHESEDDTHPAKRAGGRGLTAPDGQPVKLPMIVLDGVPFFGLVPTARYLARRVGDYGNDSQLDWRTDTVLEAFSAWRDALAAAAAAAAAAASAASGKSGKAADKNRYAKVCRVHHYDRASALLLGPECDEHDQDRCIGYAGSSSRQPSLSDIFMFGILWDDCVIFGTHLMETKYPRLQGFFRWVLHSSPPVLAECRRLSRRGGVCWASFPELGVPHLPTPPQPPTMFAYAPPPDACGCGEVHPDASTRREVNMAPARPPPPPLPVRPPPPHHHHGSMFLRPGVHPPVVMMPPFAAHHHRPPHT
ncbi:unnamed protein product [Vitrella brassicaformis CCMP3155]|uniref:Uncharacterized protein n=2 Tax=Vitrella brassicaformis TaxID=1169539 RepID=A0A0G4EBE8_VITBC|nr:unnamed protein product [Vitrella brassicaformis CCMP3155]|mmetsp:Transcript_45623/g.128845  ORF Transcript_45623/g.128845 Transcript_45623/m.128845 type:complete len:407 (-) Transcript_45623:126-1346(-)|eukprot:CEL92601.1 unnamed protein product [Vitrella brassicaformis CCMP3155]